MCQYLIVDGKMKGERLVAPLINSKKNQRVYFDKEGGGVKSVQYGLDGEDVEVTLGTGARAWQCILIVSPPSGHRTLVQRRAVIERLRLSSDIVVSSYGLNEVVLPSVVARRWSDRIPLKRSRRLSVDRT